MKRTCGWSSSAAESPATVPCYGVAFPRREGIGLCGLAVDHHEPGFVAHVLDNPARTPIGRLVPHEAIVHRRDAMLPRFCAGCTRQLARFLERGERSPRLAFAGDHLVGAFTEAALTSGLRAASEISRLGPTQEFVSRKEQHGHRRTDLR